MDRGLGYSRPCTRGLNEGILKWGYFGKVTLPQVFKVSDRAVVIPVAVIIVLTLFLMEVAGL